MSNDRFMRHHYGASGFVKAGTVFCVRCDHPQDWHRHDDFEWLSQWKWFALRDKGTGRYYAQRKSARFQ